MELGNFSISCPTRVRGDGASLLRFKREKPHPFRP